MSTKVDTIDSTIKYLRFIVLICTLLTIISGIICYYISNKVSMELNPIVAQIEATDVRLSNHKEIIGITINQINKDIEDIKKNQERLITKIDKLMNLMIKNQ